MVNAQEGDYRALQKQQRDLLLQIEATSLKLRTVEQDVDVSLEQLRLLSQRVQLRKQYIAGITEDINQTENEINKIKEEIENQVENLEKEKQMFAKVVRSMQKNTYFQNNLLFILSAKSIAQSYRRFEYLREIYAWQRRQVKTIKDRQDELLFQQKGLEKKRTEKLELLSVQQSQDIKLFTEEKEQRAFVEKLKSERGALQAELRKQEDKELDISVLIEQAISQGTNDALTLTAPSLSQRSESTTDEKDDNPVVEKPVSDFGSFKGYLPAPVAEKYTVISKFGDEKEDKNSQTTVKNGGIDIRSHAKQAYVVSSGEVSAVFSSDGNSTSIVVKHGEYLSVYANLKSVAVKKGDQVSAGQLLGTINQNPETGESVLHFQVRKGRQKLNPEEWLKR